MLAVAIPGFVIALFLILVARPAAVWLCLWPFGFDPRERLFIGWVGLRGAVSIFLASIPTLSGLPNSHIYFNIAFFVVIISLLLQGWTIKPVARRLGQALPRTVHPVTRTEVDLPGQHDVELIGYPIGIDARVLSMSKLPSWTRLTMVVREGQILGPVEAGALAPGDYAYLLAPELKIQSLDSIFAPATELRGITLEGEFDIFGDAPIDKLDEFYGLGAGPEERKRTVAELFAERFDKTPEIGDSLQIGAANLVVRDLEDGNVRHAALQLAADDLPIAKRVRRFARRVARRS
jgi:cell volume regulation protein A